MRLKPIAIGIALFALILRFYVGDYDQANAELESFYAQILSADFVAARKSIDEAIALWPSNARCYAWRAYVISQSLTPRCPHALQDFKSALNTKDQSAIHLAIADYGKALKLNRRDAVAYHNLGWLEHLSGDDASSLRELANAVAVDPGNAVFHLSYGMLLEELRDKDKSREEYQIAIELSPSIVDSQFFTRYRIRDQESADL